MTLEILKYSKKIIWVHWITLVLAIGQIITGKMLQQIESPLNKTILFQLHFTFGIFVLLLTVMRIRLFFKDPRPEKPRQLSIRHKKFIKIIHIAFYIVLLLLGLTGLSSMTIEKSYWYILMGRSFLSDGNRSIVLISHFALTKIFILLIILHFTGFLWHWIRFRENRLKVIS